jgi:hypothetical protein
LCAEKEDKDRYEPPESQGEKCVIHMYLHMHVYRSAGHSRLCRNATWIENHAFLSSLTLHPLFHIRSRVARATPSVAMNDVRRQAQTCQTAQLLPEIAQSRRIDRFETPLKSQPDTTAARTSQSFKLKYHPPLALVEILNDLPSMGFKLHKITNYSTVHTKASRNRFA